MVQNIEENGLLDIICLGGIHNTNIPAHSVIVKNRAGKKIRGITTSKPVHFLTAAERADNSLNIEDIRIDVGASSRREVMEDYGVAVGDPGQNQQFSDFWLIDASYLSIRNLNLSYSFPKNICNKLGMENLNAYIGVQNLYTFGNEYSEISSTVTVPMPRTCTFGLQFAF